MSLRLQARTLAVPAQAAVLGKIASHKQQKKSLQLSGTTSWWGWDWLDNARSVGPLLNLCG